jgi:hypothetical protein
MWKEVVIAQFKVLFQHIFGSTEENHKKSDHDSCSLGSDFNLSRSATTEL